MTKRQSIWASLLISQFGTLIFSPVLYDLLRYLHPIVLTVVWACITAGFMFLFLLIAGHSLNVPKWLLWSGMLVYSASLLVLLFNRPSTEAHYSANLIPFSTIIFYLSGKVPPLIAFYNLVANIGLFVPYGSFLLWLRQRGKIGGASLIGIPIVVVSIIELTQYFTMRGTLDMDDLVLNCFGVSIGYGLYPLVRRVIRLTS